MKELSTLATVIIGVLTSFIIFILLPAIFNQVKKLWYLKKNKGYSDGFNMHQSMYYDAKKGTIEADQSPIH